MQYKERHLKVWEVAALLTLSLALCLGCWAQNRQARLSAQIVRLHVIAVSDEEAEQALKLRVRDAVLAYLGPELEGIDDAQEARALLEARLPPRPGPAGGLQNQPAALGQGEKGPVRRARAERDAERRLCTHYGGGGL